MTCTDKSILGGAFFIMEYLPGDNIISAPPETIPDLLGETHAALHRIDPALVSTAQGFATYENSFVGRLDWLNRSANEYPWLRENVDWLIENCPSKSERLAICHGDFHPFNILFEHGKVTGVLDWPGFIIADPVLDVAFTLVYLTIPFRHLYPQIQWDYLTQGYLDVYRAQRSLDLTYLDYYRVLRCTTAFVDGADGQELWKHPVIEDSLVEYIHCATEIRVIPPNDTR